MRALDDWPARAIAQAGRVSAQIAAQPPHLRARLMREYGPALETMIELAEEIGMGADPHYLTDRINAAITDLSALMWELWGEPTCAARRRQP